MEVNVSRDHRRHNSTRIYPLERGGAAHHIGGLTIRECSPRRSTGCNKQVIEHSKSEVTATVNLRRQFSQISNLKAGPEMHNL